MDDKTVPYIVFEATTARSERTIKRLIIALLVSVVLLFAANAAWLYAWTRYDYAGTETVYQQDGEGVNVIGSGNEAGIYGSESD